jgi:hypothetical protein
MDGRRRRWAVPLIEMFRVDALADLNGDDRMELVTHGQSFEGGGTTVWELRDGSALTAVLGAGCGS